MGALDLGDGVEQELLLELALSVEAKEGDEHRRREGEGEWEGGREEGERGARRECTDSIGQDQYGRHVPCAGWRKLGRRGRLGGRPCRYGSCRPGRECERERRRKMGATEEEEGGDG